MTAEQGSPTMSDELREALAEKVSDSLAATTEGTDWAEAPEPSDEPGSPYVMRLTNELIARGVALAARPDSPTLDVERLVDAIWEVEKASGWDLNVGPGPLAEAIAHEYAALAPSSAEGEDER